MTAARINFKDYDHNRISQPWGAVVTFDGDQPCFDQQAALWLGGSHGRGGDLVVEASPGQVIIAGQKNLKTGRDLYRWFLLGQNGELIETDEAGAKAHFAAGPYGK